LEDAHYGVRFIDILAVEFRGKLGGKTIWLRMGVNWLSVCSDKNCHPVYKSGPHFVKDRIKRDEAEKAFLALRNLTGHSLVKKAEIELKNR
jgi:hypothetical protein